MGVLKSNMEGVALLWAVGHEMKGNSALSMSCAVSLFLQNEERNTSVYSVKNMLIPLVLLGPEDWHFSPSQKHLKITFQTLDLVA